MAGAACVGGQDVVVKFGCAAQSTQQKETNINKKMQRIHSVEVIADRGSVLRDGRVANIL